MDNADKTKLREFIRETLAEVGDHHDFADDSSLFASGRLTSLSMTQLVVFLENTSDIDFASVGFDVELFDSVNDIAAFIDAESAQRA